ncbi:ketohydroxyglutarate aldolase [Accumulibacter sp.]|uniref:ketohydroxyglutarate aldolase n=1 Tax=Accumulibacter sp. TaxID=2053492 RepID=UPI0026173540|nr:ketohydroxyglutarate aldolase [Accumulibacter sp.]
MDEAQVQSVIVTIDDAHLADIQSVAHRLGAAGLQVSRVMSTIGIIAGRAPASSIAHLKAVRGVLEIEADREMHAFGGAE